MRSTILHETRRFTCTSYGNGLAYALEKRLTHDSILFQGDDAFTFREELDKLAFRRLKLTYDDVLGILWNDYQEVASSAPLASARTKPVAVTLETVSGIDVVARFDTVAEAEDYLATSAGIDPDLLKAGNYGVDAPERMINP